MSAEIIQLRDYQNPKDIERMQRELEKEAAKILAETVEQPKSILSQLGLSVPYGGKGIDGMNLRAPDGDSA